jgi:DsbC/DsbD-like thiol-disulfide interchange protein
MRTLALITLLATPLLAQTSAPALQFRGEPGSKHATIVAAPAEAAGGKAMLFLDVTPKAGIHVYAPGSKDYIPISVKLEPTPGVKPGKVTYPKAEMMKFGDENVPVFQKAFRLTQEVALDKSAAAAGSTVSVAATVHLQACDDRVCFPPENVPVKWTVAVK